MSGNEPALILKPGREKALLRRHPWVFSGAIGRVNGNPHSGQVVNIYSSKKEFLGKGAYSHNSQIAVRVWSWNETEEINEAFLSNRIQASISRRAHLFDVHDTNAFRLVHAESDGLPGLIVDKYADILVLQLLSWGAEVWRDQITEILLELTGASSVYERSDPEVRKLEGLPEVNGWIKGNGEAEIEIKENELKFLVDLAGGHKTGFYLDQRKNRLAIRKYVNEKEVLDCFSYTGGFALNALRGGAKKVTCADTSEAALEMIMENLSLNQMDASYLETIPADVFSQLRDFRDRGKTFDVVILDPPKFAPTRAQVDKASRAYKDINLFAFKLLKPGGYLITYSCSGGVDAGLFQKIVAGAALDAGITAHIVEHLFQGEDHPVSLNFPEGAYLKGLVCRVS